ncbi:glutathione S-transferase family protein [Wenxinia marina]|uniref:Glutathione S-transferase n=1 Tax=Wenxinia marina DSM 24838 TaxID=1123501 RepID=A0A0D0Q8P6_9RHOB|nr:glutathione S-transferase family protein [Wenxinia marina]KIQ68727.1 Glutathione S-transferase [Wenxinia marina DSM 24838]GGL65623.1 glutathione S-transferase [Wenxinia marina]
MQPLILTTFDWVPEGPRGYVRDLRVRWALEEAGLPYEVRTTNAVDRGADHLARQPFAQVPYLQDGDLCLFESGAILCWLGRRSPALMPQDEAGRAVVTQWIFAALNSVEPHAVAWASAVAKGAEPPATLGRRLDGLERELTGREWIAGAFSAADIALADVLRGPDRRGGLDGHPAVATYLARATARPAFRIALADQLEHFAKAPPPGPVGGAR